MNIDFKVMDHRDSKEKGITLTTTKGGRIIIYLQHHESIKDIYDTITHELIHYCLSKYNHVELDEYQEHDLIFKTQWIDAYLSLDDTVDMT